MGGNKQADKDIKMLKTHVAALMEHFDSVQIFATKPSPGGGTIRCDVGGGNWFARYGQVSLWVDGQSFYGEENNDDFSMEV